MLYDKEIKAIHISEVKWPTNRNRDVNHDVKIFSP